MIREETFVLTVLSWTKKLSLHVWKRNILHLNRIFSWLVIFMCEHVNCDAFTSYWLSSQMKISTCATLIFMWIKCLVILIHMWKQTMAHEITWNVLLHMWIPHFPHIFTCGNIPDIVYTRCNQLFFTTSTLMKTVRWKPAGALNHLHAWLNITFLLTLSQCNISFRWCKYCCCYCSSLGLLVLRRYVFITNKSIRLSH